MHFKILENGNTLFRSKNLEPDILKPVIPVRNQIQPDIRSVV